MNLSISEQNIIAVAKVSALHILDKDFLFGMANKKEAGYVSLNNPDTVTVDLNVMGKGWPAIRNKLCEDGWDSDLLPGLMDIFRRAVAQQIGRIEFNDKYAKIKYAEWFTPDTFIHLRPASYETPLLTFEELSANQKAIMRNYAGGVHEGDAHKCFLIIDDKTVVHTEDLSGFSLAEPDEIIGDYDRYIEMPGSTIAVKIYPLRNTADTAFILN